MRIEIKGRYKSICDVTIDGLTPFTILTGVNGSGKTHLMEAIHVAFSDANSKERSTPTSHHVHIHGEHEVNRVRMVSLADLLKTSIESANEQQIVTVRVSMLEKLFPSHRSLNLGFAVMAPSRGRLQVDVATSERAGALSMPPRGTREAIFVDAASQELGCEAHELTFYDLCNSPIPVQCFADEVGVGIRIGSAIVNHRIQEQENLYREFLSKKDESVSYFDDEEFSKAYPDPVQLMNRAMRACGLRYVLSDDAPKCRLDQPIPSYVPRFRNELNGAEVLVDDMSSGEKTLLSLVLAMAGLECGGRIPDLLLLDECDGVLHPEMCVAYLRMIKDVFVDRYGVYVVASTHSPTTIALSEENVIRVMTEDSSARVESLPRQEALDRLLVGVPHLSIDPERRRQIFTESRKDAYVYERLYAKLKSRLSPRARNVSLTFVSSGSGGSGSDEQVKEIVRLLRANGNTRIFGVIDSDGEKASSDAIAVMSGRYSIEQYLLDPILVVAWLIREKVLDPKALGLSDSVSCHRDLAMIPVEELQHAIDIVERRVGVQSDERAVVMLVAGYSVSFSRSWMMMNGHDYQRRVVDAFPQAFGRLKNNVLETIAKLVAEDIPSLLSGDFLGLFETLSS